MRGGLRSLLPLEDGTGTYTKSGTMLAGGLDFLALSVPESSFKHELQSRFATNVKLASLLDARSPTSFNRQPLHVLGPLAFLDSANYVPS
jgi:hypothetical protein